MSGQQQHGGGETIRISLGPTASAVSSHLCNLEGLACTSPSSYPDDGANGNDNGNSNNAPLCDPNVTHSVCGGMYVPRVLFVDGMDAFDADPWNLTSVQIQRQQQQQQQARNAAAATAGQNSDDVIISAAFPTLNVTAERQQQQEQVDGETSPTSVRQYDPRVPPSHTATTLLSSSVLSRGTGATGAAADGSNRGASGSAAPAWSGRVEVHHRTDTNDPHEQGNDPMTTFHQTAISMAQSSQSRYRATSRASYSSRFVYPPSSSPAGDGRHVQWDSDEEEGEGDGYGGYNDEYYDEEENDEMRRIRERRDAERWYGEERGASDGLVGAWDESYCLGNGGSGGQERQQQQQQVVGDGSDAVQNGSGATEAAPPAEEWLGPDLAWIDYFMPPHPPLSSYAAPLPFNTLSTPSSASDQKQKVQHQHGYLSSYFAGYHPASSATPLGSGMSLSTTWREDVLSEKIRKLLEDCDAVRGFNVVVEGGASLHGGLATSLLEELGDECRSAGRICFSVDPTSKNDKDSRVKLKASEFGRGGMVGGGADSMAEAKVIESFRSALNGSLSLYGLSSNSDIYLPISLSNCGDALARGGENSVFRSSAAAALAIEASTLPYRLLGSQFSSVGTITPLKSKIGIQSGYFAGSGQSLNGSDPYATAERLSFHEFVSCLKPSNRHTILELDARVRPQGEMDKSLNDALMQGTSVERKRIEAEANLHRGRHRYSGPPRVEEPGTWLENCGSYGGQLLPFSPLSTSGAACIRSNHTHFALSTSYRPAASDPSSDPAAAYTTPIMEGMGIKYRPQVSLGSVVRQSIRGLTGNAGYAAGAYWKFVLSDSDQTSTDDSYLNTPVLSVLGNSTRIYPYLNSTSMNLSAALSRKYRGYMARDTMAGLAPEEEDCAEAIEACFETRDAYEPPLGSGLADDDEGGYFSENED